MSKQFVEVINKIKQKNNLDFKLMDGKDIEGILEAPVIEPDDVGSITEKTLGKYIQDVATGLNADIEAHLSDKENPHEVKAAQILEHKSAFNRDFEDSTDNIKMNGTVSVGSLETVSRADHIHPTDTSRASQLEVDEIQVALGNLTSTVKTNKNEATVVHKTITDNLTNLQNSYNTFVSSQEGFNNSFAGMLTAHTQQIDNLHGKVEELEENSDFAHQLQKQELDNLVTKLTIEIASTSGVDGLIGLTFYTLEEQIIIDWGDGNLEQYSFDTEASAEETLTHMYTAKGSYCCKIYGMETLHPTFIAYSAVAGKYTVAEVLTAATLNKKLNLEGAKNQNVFGNCPANLKIIVPFDELVTYENANLGGNFDAIAYVRDIQSWAANYINNMLVTSVNEITAKNNE